MSKRGISSICLSISTVIYKCAYLSLFPNICAIILARSNEAVDLKSLASTYALKACLGSVFSVT